MNTVNITRSLFVTLAFALLSACGGGKMVVESDLQIKGAPDWVNEGTNILNSKDGRLIHGFGSAPKMGDLELQRSTAENRARSEIARVLSSYMDVVSKDYLASASAGDARETEQSVSRSIQNVSKVNLTGAKIIGNWRSDKDGTVYSLAELDMKSVKGLLSNVQDMNAGLLEHIEKHGDTIFDKMAEKK